MALIEERAQTIEAVKLLGDCAKWLITIETAAIAVVAFILNANGPRVQILVSVWTIAIVICFAVSMAAAVLLLRALPGIMQQIEPGESIWTVRDKAGLTLGLTTKRLVLTESVSFVIALMLIVTSLAVKIAAR